MPLVNKNINTIPAFKIVKGSSGPTPPVVTFFIQLEDGTAGPNGGFVLLENGVDFALREAAP